MIRFEYYPDSHGEPQNIRSIQGHNDVHRIDPKFCTVLEILYVWKVYIYHTRPSNNFRSIVEGGLIAGGTTHRRGRQACFFSAADPLESLPDFQEFAKNETRMAHCKHSERPDHDAVYNS